MTAEDIAHQIIAELTIRGMTAETGKITDYGTEFLRNKIGYSFEYAFGINKSNPWTCYTNSIWVPRTRANDGKPYNFTFVNLDNVEECWRESLEWTMEMYDMTMSDLELQNATIGEDEDLFVV